MAWAAGCSASKLGSRARTLGMGGKMLDRGYKKKTAEYLAGAPECRQTTIKWSQNRPVELGLGLQACGLKLEH